MVRGVRPITDIAAERALFEVKLERSMYGWIYQMGVAGKPSCLRIG
jgi:hypothetical protein